MNKLLLPALRSFCLITLAALMSAGAVQAADTKPLRALLILGGCCHDYEKQKDILKSGIEKRANIKVDIAYNPDKTTKTRFDIYEKPDWAKGYDVVIHDECSSDVKDMPYVENILAAHKKGVPAVNLHCAMHCYRTGTDDWFKFIGIQSSAHGPQKPIAINFVEKNHPIVRGLGDWTTINEELYNNIKLFETAKPLARGKQIVPQRDGTEKEVEFVVVWANDYGGTRVFNTTIGHNNATVSDDRYLDLVTRGVLWACGKLDDAGKPKAGFGPPAAAQ
jgi:type 1 glutamine amidotransferase